MNTEERDFPNHVSSESAAAVVINKAFEEAMSKPEKVNNPMGTEVLRVVEGIPVPDLLTEAYCLDDNVLRALEGAWEPDGMGSGVDASMCLVLAHSLRCSLALQRAAGIIR
jgi:hypothetical protein